MPSPSPMNEGCYSDVVGPATKGWDKVQGLGFMTQEKTREGC